MPHETQYKDLLLAFNASNQLAVRRVDQKWYPALPAGELNTARTQLHTASLAHTEPVRQYVVATPQGKLAVHFCQVADHAPTSGYAFLSIEQLTLAGTELDPVLMSVLADIDAHLIAIPYLHLGENDYIYRFRVERERNRAIYGQDGAAEALYQSKLCAAIKALARTSERTAGRPAVLDFGAVRYIVPSHFGFCLGVKNAIERAYETLAENPERRVFMLSELIHNPFVNEDLLRRGLLYLQTDKGLPYGLDGTVVPPGSNRPLLWDTLTGEDVVIIPAFGATDHDKKRLVRKGLKVAQYDATCMLVEKVWKSARAYGREGFTIIIHGKSEHEETKATFSNTRRHAPAIIIRHMDEARVLGEYITAPTPAKRSALLERFGPVATPGFDPDRHLERIAVVNQTTLLMNETSSIIDYFEAVFTARHGPGEATVRIGGAGRKDTLCYATQVNQDALSRALDQPLDAAFVIGGKNSSNTYQLHRLCEQRLGERAYFIQSEANIRSRTEVDHFVFSAHRAPADGRMEVRPLWSDCSPKTVLLTGGASCPDGLVQQVITRINTLFPAGKLRPVDAVLEELSGL